MKFQDPPGRSNAPLCKFFGEATERARSSYRFPDGLLFGRYFAQVQMAQPAGQFERKLPGTLRRHALIGYHGEKERQRILFDKFVRCIVRRRGNRSSMLRNVAQNKVWQFGVTAIPALWPFPHFKLKSRVLFAEPRGDKAGPVFEDKDLQHSYRRSICKGWRNKHWHGRLRAFVDLLTGEHSSIKLPLGAAAVARLDPLPMFFTSPVTTALPDVMLDEDEEHDDSTLTGKTPQQEEE